MSNLMSDKFGKVANGLCRLTMNGDIAIKTSNGDYKYYNVKKGRLINCDNFVFPIGTEFFFVLPVRKVKPGDIILVNNNDGSRKPRCVKSVDGDNITVINYDNSTVEIILPERHLCMGNVYFFAKIVSMFGNTLASDKNKGFNNIMKYMIMTDMMSNKNDSGNGNAMASMMPVMMLMGKDGGFEDMFNFDFDFDGEAEVVGTDDDDSEEEDNE